MRFLRNLLDGLSLFQLIHYYLVRHTIFWILSISSILYRTSFIMAPYLSYFNSLSLLALIFFPLALAGLGLHRHNHGPIYFFCLNRLYASVFNGIFLLFRVKVLLLIPVIFSTSLYECSFNRVMARLIC